MEDNNQKFAEYLKRIRLEKKKTLVQLADASGTSNSYLSQLENTKRNPPKPELLRNIAKALSNSDENEEHALYQELLKKAGYLPDEPYVKMMTQKQTDAWNDFFEKSGGKDLLDKAQDEARKQQLKQTSLDDILNYDPEKMTFSIGDKTLNQSEIKALQYLLKGIQIDNDQK